MQKTNKKLDTLYHIEIPEGVDLHAELAGLTTRALAFTIDFSFRFIALVIMLIASSFLGEAGIGLWLIIFFFLEWFYPIFFELFRDGQTPGKKYLGIKVVSQDITPVKLQSSLIRNLLRAVDFLPVFYVFGIVSLVISGKFQRLGDLAAGTLVIYKPHEAKHKKLDTSIAPIVHHQPLTQQQQMAIIQFAQNRGGLSQARQAEIAELLRDVIPDNQQDAVVYLQGVGKWLLGDYETS